MKQFMTMIEDLWVAVTFAESGIYAPTEMFDSQPICHDSVSIHTV
jgi:hypothetical protein